MHPKFHFCFVNLKNIVTFAVNKLKPAYRVLYPKVLCYHEKKSFYYSTYTDIDRQCSGL